MEIRRLVIDKHRADLSTAIHQERKAKAEADLAVLSFEHAKKMVEQEEKVEKVFDLPGFGGS